MRISKLMMPALTLAGALALAGCGGGSGTPGTGGGGGGTAFTNNTTCSNGTTVTGTGSTAAAAAAAAADKCPPDPTPDAKLKGATAATLLTDAGTIRVLAARSSDTRVNAVAYGHSVGGKYWDEILTVVEKDIDGNGRVQRAVSANGYEVPGSNPFPGGNGAIDSTYKGIDGMFHCAANTECASNKRTLGAGWYFIPDTGLDNNFWKKASDSSGNYEAVTPSAEHAEWGYWIDTASGDSTVYRRARLLGDGTSVLNAASVMKDALAVNNTATYSGTDNAHGVSVMGDNAGTFTADASLAATFDGDGTTLEGTVTNFEGMAVNTGWSLKFGKIADNADDSTGSPTTADRVFDQGTTSGGTNVKTGDWTGRLYGKAASRPSGVVGDFDGYFADGGQVTGVYHADNK